MSVCLFWSKGIMLTISVSMLENLSLFYCLIMLKIFLILCLITLKYINDQECIFQNHCNILTIWQKNKNNVKSWESPTKWTIKALLKKIWNNLQQFILSHLNVLSDSWFIFVVLKFYSLFKKGGSYAFSRLLGLQFTINDV